ncbi:MAG: hypothetical protein WD709_07555, partial [Gammaproteobacteria bacterium]
MSGNLHKFCLLAVIAVSPVFADPLIYRAPEGAVDLRTQYFVDLLELALAQTEAEYGPLETGPSAIFIAQDRAFSLVENGSYLDIVWGMTNTQRERDLAPIRIPLLKGLLGCRVAIIRQDRIDEFRNISDINTLKNYTVVQGTGWPDVDILRENGFNIITTPHYEGMFAMIAAGRADLFFRGVTEAWVEIESVPYNNLAVDTAFLLTYQGPIYFFVNRERRELVERISNGLRSALDNGSFDEVVNSHPYIIQAKAELARHERRIVHLRNPDLPGQTPLSEQALWMEL